MLAACVFPDPQGEETISIRLSLIYAYTS